MVDVNLSHLALRTTAGAFILNGENVVTRPVLEPSPQHPITIEPASSQVTVKAGDILVADTTAALALREANYPTVYYVPLADVRPEVLQASNTTTYCPYKGDASYYSIATPAGELTDAAPVGSTIGGPPRNCRATARE